MLALRATQDPPPHVLLWLQDWAKKAKPGTALIALLGIPQHATETTDRTQHLLEITVRRHELKVLPLEFNIPANLEATEPTTLWIPPKVPETADYLSFLPPENTHWGLNE